MNDFMLKSSLVVAVYVTCSSFSFGQHSQDVHETLVDDFYAPYPFSLEEKQTFTGSIGELKPVDDVDLWDYYVFQTPVTGEIDIVLDNFNSPVSLSLERSFPEEHKKPDALAESFDRHTDSHRIKANLAPLTTYYIAVGTGLPDNGSTPYSLTVTFQGMETEPKPISPVADGEYELTLSSKTCYRPEFATYDIDLPVYVVSGTEVQLSGGSEAHGHVDQRIHEMLRFDPAHGMLVHEFSDVLFDDRSSASLQRDVVVIGSFEDGRFNGQMIEHGTVQGVPEESNQETASCSGQVTAIGR